jgi:glycosyltransferase involved in cell wall biosynthesis
MGTHWGPIRPAGVLVHEYISASTPPFPHLKNFLKCRFNHRPDGYVFGSEWAAHALGFPLASHCCIRPAGVAASFFRQEDAVREFDMVYVGDMGRSRRLVPVISRILHALPGFRLLLVGEPSVELLRVFRTVPEVFFTGKVLHDEVPGLLARAEYGLNLIPNRYPFRWQPSLKLMEYCALGLKVISTDIPWARAFEYRRKGRFFFLRPDVPISREALRRFPFHTPSVTDLHWDTLLQDSGLAEWLDTLCQKN